LVPFEGGCLQALGVGDDARLDLLTRAHFIGRARAGVVEPSTPR
jgi:hypothetical protein